MAGKRPELRARCYVSIDDAAPVLLESLTEDQRTYVAETLTKKFAAGLSDYYNQHPEEYCNLPEVNPTEMGTA